MENNLILEKAEYPKCPICGGLGAFYWIEPPEEICLPCLESCYRYILCIQLSRKTVANPNEV